MANPIGLEVTRVSKTFIDSKRQVEVLREVSFSMAAGQSLAIMGPSGSGKSTLLHLLGTLDTPTAGRILINGDDPFRLDEPALARFRNRGLGLIFQDHYLLPQYSILENVMLPALAFAPSGEGPEARARQLLVEVGLGGRLDHRPAELSGGERQRATVVRALINSPGLLLCDEPTGNLDQEAADVVTGLLWELHRRERNIMIVVTHSQRVARRLDRQLLLREGRCVEA